MIELPTSAAPSGATPALLDTGIVQRDGSGAITGRWDRPGMRWRVDFSLPKMKADTARVVISRLAQAKSDGLRIEYPLLDVVQTGSGSPLVDGALASGSNLPLRGMTPGYVLKEGFWLAVQASDGQRCLHNVRVTTTVAVNGKATAIIWPPLRVPLVDGNLVLIDAPTIEGQLISDVGWSLTPDQLAETQFTIEEMA